MHLENVNSLQCRNGFVGANNYQDDASHLRDDAIQQHSTRTGHEKAGNV